ncbi:MAG TPA: sulfotransferase family 2 domain-containing protein [Anaerolineae bacterium]|nr:sulfotransferase family 2 domain-containing protein [Anaerolineae bacterium]
MKTKHVIFLHIPKTAGTTLHTILDRQYAPETIHSFDGDAHGSTKAFKALPAERRDKIALLRGHMAYGLHEFFAGETTYFTVLRDPVKRVISEYNYILRTPPHYLYDFVTENKLDLRGTLDSGEALMMNDACVRLLSGVWGDVGYMECTPDMLAVAKKRLDEMIVGLTERFDETVCLLRNELGWEAPITYERKNVTRSGVAKEGLDRETLATIEKANQLDMALYAHGQKRFEEQLKAQGVLFPAQVGLLRLNNRYGYLYWRLRRYSVRVYVKNLWRKLGSF